MAKRAQTPLRKSSTIQLRYPELHGAGSEKPDYKGKYTTMVCIPKKAEYVTAHVSDEQKDKIALAAKVLYKSLMSDLKEIACKGHGADALEDESGIHWDDVLQDGDKKKNKKTKKPLCPGFFFFNTWTKNKPKIKRSRDADGIIGDEDSDEIYSGVWVKIGYNIYSYASSNRDGVTIGLSGVKKIFEGDQLGGGEVSWDNEDDEDAPEPTDEDFEGQKEDKEDKAEDWDSIA